MLYYTCISYLIVSILYVSSLHAQAEQKLDRASYESITGLKGAFNEKENVFKASFPREDVTISVDGLPLDPFMGLTSWSSYTPCDENTFMVMGDLALFQDEVNPVMSSLLHNNLQVTALHNHFFYDNPRVFFMHIGGKGSLRDLSYGVKEALKVIQEIRHTHPSLPIAFEGPTVSRKNDIPLPKLEKIFSTSGQSKDGMAKFIFGREVTMDSLPVHKDMGVNTWAAFAGTEEQAVADGDFALFEHELQPVLKTLRKHGMFIVAIHNHMTMESPKMLFLHFWGKGKAEDLAKAINEALLATTQGKMTSSLALESPSK